MAAANSSGGKARATPLLAPRVSALVNSLPLEAGLEGELVEQWKLWGIVPFPGDVLFGFYFFFNIFFLMKMKLSV